MSLAKLSKNELLTKCEEMGFSESKSKNKKELIEIIDTNDKSKKHKIKNKDDNIIIINNDCMIELNKLEDNSIDCVITDPPYFIDKLDNNWSSSKINNDVKNSHITHLPKGMKFDKSQVKNLYDFYLNLSKLLFKKMKPGAYFFIIFISKIISCNSHEL